MTTMDEAYTVKEAENRVLEALVLANRSDFLSNEYMLNAAKKAVEKWGPEEAVVRAGQVMSGGLAL